MDDVQGCTNVMEDMDVDSDRAKVEQCTTAWKQEVRAHGRAKVEQCRSNCREQRMEQLPRKPEPRAVLGTTAETEEMQ